MKQFYAPFDDCLIFLRSIAISSHATDMVFALDTFMGKIHNTRFGPYTLAHEYVKWQLLLTSAHSSLHISTRACERRRSGYKPIFGNSAREERLSRHSEHNFITLFGFGPFFWKSFFHSDSLMSMVFERESPFDGSANHRLTEPDGLSFVSTSCHRSLFILPTTVP
jgi:hypothetical protein